MADIPTITATTPVVVPPPPSIPTFDGWWITHLNIDASNQANVSVSIQLNRCAHNGDGSLRLMTSMEATEAGVQPGFGLTLSRILQRTLGQSITDDAADPTGALNTSQVQTALASIMTGLEGVGLLIGQSLGKL